MSIWKKINKPNLLLDKENFQKIQQRTSKLLDEVFSIEELLKSVYSLKENLKKNLNKWQDLTNALQEYIDNILWIYNLKVKLNWLYLYTKHNNIIEIEKIIGNDENEDIIESIQNNKQNWDNSKLLLPIYKLIKKENNIRSYISLQIIKWDYRKIFFILNVIFWALNNIINEIFELKYNNIIKNSKTDELTRTYTRWSLKKIIKNDILNKKINEEIYLMFLDIDNFKKINDTFWHDIWDEILKQFTLWIKNTIRHNIDYVWRWWWEEFIVVFKFENIDKDRINQILEQKIQTIKNNIQPKNIKWIDKITFSWWIVNTTEINYHNWKDNIEDILIKLINKADERMYKAKKTWKDKIVFDD